MAEDQNSTIVHIGPRSFTLLRTYSGNELTAWLSACAILMFWLWCSSVSYGFILPCHGTVFYVGSVLPKIVITPFEKERAGRLIVRMPIFRRFTSF